MLSRLKFAVTLCVIFVCSVSMQASSTSAYKRPKLVVCIVVDQLRTDYLDLLQSRMGTNGFLRLATRGVYMRNVISELENADKTSATALLYTGAYPNENGVPSALVYDLPTHRLKSVFADNKQLGNYTTQNLSPKALMLSTLSDEMMIDAGGMCSVYAISTDASQSLIMSGHAGTNAAWLNTENGQWATSTYFRSVPQPVQKVNMPPFSVPSRIDTMRWKPMYDVKSYEGVPLHKRQYPFMHTFGKSDPYRYDRLAASPIGNREVTNLAIDYLEKLGMGKREDAPDMLNIGYTLAPYKYIEDGDYRLELQDAYLRLDADLARLFGTIEHTVGMQNTVVVLMSTCYYNDAVKDADEYNIPSGDFSVRRSLSLLNSYLVAKYGNGDYIDGHSDRSIFLNHELLTQRGVRLDDVRRECKAFLLRMSGVAKVYTIDQLMTPDTDETERFARGVNLSAAGDIIYRIAPGWNLVDDNTLPIVTTPVRYGSALHPVFILIPGQQPRVITDAVSAVSLAPTLSSLLKIRTPNGASHQPVTW